MNLDFWVPGTPKTKGSVTSRPNGSIDHGDAVYDRQKDIVTAAKKEMARIGWIQIRPPMALVVVLATFVPYNAADAVMMLEAPTDQRHGDVDKYPRTVLDALEQAGVCENDSQVVELTSRKHFAVGNLSAAPLFRSTEPFEPGDHIVVMTIGSALMRRFRDWDGASDAVRRARGLGADRPTPRGW